MCESVAGPTRHLVETDDSVSRDLLTAAKNNAIYYLSRDVMRECMRNQIAQLTLFRKLIFRSAVTERLSVVVTAAIHW